MLFCQIFYWQLRLLNIPLYTQTRIDPNCLTSRRNRFKLNLFVLYCPFRANFRWRYLLHASKDLQISIFSETIISGCIIVPNYNLICWNLLFSYWTCLIGGGEINTPKWKLICTISHYYCYLTGEQFHVALNIFKWQRLPRPFALKMYKISQA